MKILLFVKNIVVKIIVIVSSCKGLNFIIYFTHMQIRQQRSLTSNVLVMDISFNLGL